MTWLMINFMKLDHESVAQWYERSIVEHSLAAAQEEALTDAANETAVRVMQKRTDQAAAEMQQALAALQAQRRLGT